MNINPYLLKKNAGLAFCLLLLLPLFFFDINNFHDWGDDFAQYILQSAYLSGDLEKLPVNNSEGYSPAVKGVLFSALLVPFGLFAPTSILGGKILVSLTLVLCGVLICFKLSQITSVLNSLAITCFIIYNMQVLNLKDQVLPDFLFTALTILVFIYLSKPNPDIFRIIIIAAISCMVKSAGYITLTCIAVFIIAGKFYYNSIRYSKVKVIGFLIVCALIPIALERIIFNDKPALDWYFRTIIEGISMETINYNFYAYQNAIILFFEHEIPMWMNIILKISLLLFIAGGFALKSVRNFSVMEMFVILYMCILIIYPYQKEPFRFLIPVMFIGMFYMIEFFNFLIAGKKPLIKDVLLFLLPVILFSISLKSLANTKFNNRHYEPFTDDAIEIISYLRKNVDENQPITGSKPWAISYFTGHKSTPLSSLSKTDWLLLMDSDVDPKNLMDYTIVLRDEKYSIYKK